MRPINKIVHHCSATRPGSRVDAKVIRGWHVAPKARGGRGWKDIGYHFVILPDGTVETGRALEKIGAHVAGFNTGSIGICWVGGLDASGRPADNRTPQQKAAQARLTRELAQRFGLTAEDIYGHRDLSPDRDGDGVVERHEWLKACPCFDAPAEARAWLA